MKRQTVVKWRPCLAGFEPRPRDLKSEGAGTNCIIYRASVFVWMFVIKGFNTSNTLTLFQSDFADSFIELFSTPEYLF